jgi:hypothetical protein
MTVRNRPVTVYISAASDLMAERETLARMIAALPVTLAWNVVQSPVREAETLDLEALQWADLHVLVMGSDIRAPIGLEWYRVQRAGGVSVAFLKRGVPRTPAGQVFIRDARLAWRPFKDAGDLSRQVQRLLAEHLVRHAPRYDLAPDEVERLEALLKAEERGAEPSRGQEPGHSAVILSRERYEPREGIVVDG